MNSVGLGRIDILATRIWRADTSRSLVSTCFNRILEPWETKYMRMGCYWVAIGASPPCRSPQGLGNRKALRHYMLIQHYLCGCCKNISTAEKGRSNQKIPKVKGSVTRIPGDTGILVHHAFPILSGHSSDKAMPWWRNTFADAMHGGSFRSSWFSLFRRGTKIAEEGEANSSDMGSRWIEGQQWSPWRL